MKTSKYSVLKAIAVCAVLLIAARPAKAQLIPRSYVNVDWQMNVPTGNSFAGDASGWGMNFEGGYYVTSKLAIGPFINFHTNFEDIPRQTLYLGDGAAMTVAQEHATFQLPFGLTTRYSFNRDRVIQPYVGMKLGANYAEFSSYYYVVRQYLDTWGFHVQPELGINIFPNPEYRFGIHIAAYYGYSTNSGKMLTYSIDNISNFGIRVGVSF